MANELILIRHGNAARVDGDYVQAPLTELGRQQAILTGQYLYDTHERPDEFYCSPLRRAQETAALIGARISCVPRSQNGLQEMEMAELPPLFLLESLVRLGIFRNYLQVNAGKPVRWPIVGRVSRVLTELISRHPGRRLALVTHGGVISATLAWYFPLEQRRWWRERVDNCSLTRLQVHGTRAELILLNDIGHLKSLGATPREQQ